jgi:hypothetical protein
MSETTGREPIITPEGIRRVESWDYTEPVTDRVMQYTIGFITDQMIPVMAIFGGDDNLPMLIPLDVLVHAIKVGAEKEEND